MFRGGTGGAPEHQDQQLSMHLQSNLTTQVGRSGRLDCEGCCVVCQRDRCFPAAAREIGAQEGH